MSEPSRVSRRAFLSFRKAPLASETDPAPAAPAPTAAPATPSAPDPTRHSIFPLLRPPGAVAEADFLARCTRCNECASACPHHAIVPAPPRLRGAAGTPLIEPMKAPCRLCADRPCATVCEPGVIRLDAPARIGTAQILRHSCLAWQGSFCSVCVEQCPVPGAIAVAAGKPTVDAAICTGCGVCAYVCPAPFNAVAIRPTPLAEQR